MTLTSPGTSTTHGPTFADLNTLTTLVNGEPYWVLVSDGQEDVVLNNRARTLTCVGGDCWNQLSGKSTRASTDVKSIEHVKPPTPKRERRGGKTPHKQEQMR